MSFLAPLYALAALTIAAPILFHFLQRRPQSQETFSSLMFLRSSPPRLTRRHRLNNLWLLILRGMALLLLAAAFAKPFLRSTSLLDLDTPSRSIVLVIDTSASMRRAGIWEETLKMAEIVIDDLRPKDQVSLITFDRLPQTLVSFETWKEAEPSKRVLLLREQLAGLEPTWHATNLGSALIAACDTLLRQRLIEDHHQPLQIVLCSDLQTGSDLAVLQSYQWPEEIAVDLRTSLPPRSTNVSLQALPPVAEELDATQVRVLVRNEADSEKAQFQLAWEGTDDDVDPIDVHVPPGQIQVVRISQPDSARCLVVRGDDHDFDNTLYVTRTTPQNKQLLFIGAEETGRQSLFFYLRQVSLDTRTRHVSIERWQEDGSLANLEPTTMPLVVIAQPLEVAQTTDVRRYVRRGGRVLVVLEEDTANSAMAEFLRALFELPDLLIENAETEDYAMLARIDFQNPLFAPFADPRYNDFTKICFWKHRRLTSSHEEPWTVVARFDDQSPALVEKSLEDGTIWILTSGWQPAESQLALSWKFITLLHGMFGPTAASQMHTVSYTVGQPLPISPSQESTIVQGPDGSTFSLPAMTEFFAGAEIPGIYGLQQGTDLYSVAVNLAPGESRTQPLAPDRLEQLGVQLGEHERVEVLREEQRQMRNRELESRQKLWRWGVLAALMAIACETWLGARAAKNTDAVTQT